MSQTGRVLPTVPASGVRPLVVPDLLTGAAQDFPRGMATHFFGAEVTYADLLGQTLKFAASLKGMGIGPGDRVAVMLPNCPQAAVSVFALHWLGAACVMVNPTSPAPEIAFLLGDSEARAAILLDHFFPRMNEARANSPRCTDVIVTSLRDAMPGTMAMLYRLKATRDSLFTAVPYGYGVHRWKDMLKGQEHKGPPNAEPSTLALLQYTGGTTGRPKGVLLTHANLTENVMQMGEWLFEARRGQERLLAVLPYFHVFGLTCALLFPVGMAGAVIMQPRFEVPEVLKAIGKLKPSLLPAIPAMFAALVRDPRVKRETFSSLSWCISGSSALSEKAAQLFLDRTGIEILQGYGLTETSPVTHVNPAYGLRKRGSIGPPVARTECRIVDLEAGTTEMPRGEPGELVIRGPQVMQGYWRLPEETAQALRDGWLYTGDVATVDDEGYYYIVDRKKEMVITAGFNVYPSEVEQAILEMGGVKEVAVIGLPDDLRGEDVAAYLVLDEGVTLSAEEVRRHCRERLAAHKVPRVVRFRSEFPKSLIGKVLKRELKREALEAKKD